MHWEREKTYVKRLFLEKMEKAGNLEFENAAKRLSINAIELALSTPTELEIISP